VSGSRLFEHLVTTGRARELREEPTGRVEIEGLDPADSHERIARHVAREIERALSAVGGDKLERLNKQAAIANDLLTRIRELAPPGPPSAENVEPPPRLLLSVHDGTPPVRTELPFGVTTVLTRARGEPAIGHELEREIATAESIDALVSFVTVSGVRALREALEKHAQDGGRLRLLTTTYTGATDAEALEALAGLPNVQVRISYDARRTRLHAKAWLFSRASGLDTAYVGSANLSSSALFQGHEWMVKVSAADLPAVIAKFRGTFETLWNDPEFEPFDVSVEEHRARLRQALAAERGGGRHGPATLTFFTLAPYPFQTEILERLQAERELHGRRRNLVVAATGAGKTVVAAFDYKRRIGSDGLPPRLLFLAHREEILAQALATFRNVLRDGAFGDLLVGGEEPARYDHLFASIQSVNSRGLLDRFGAECWDHVVIDECHHAPAQSYQAVVGRIRPAVLVGLTATPERADGQSLLPDFDNHIAAELRLWHALERQLLVPFEYYGISDNTDLRDARWSRGSYVTEDLEKLYTGNDHRASLVIGQTLRRVGDPRRMRALGFCVSVAHAQFMARRFSEAGIPALAVHGGSSDADREGGPRRLERREVNVLFTCDLYNEGIDLPFDRLPTQAIPRSAAGSPANR
jgi:superfamily II DNA or RNA helicase/HKD family nuclease